jgi:hypothetical protein
MFFFTSVKITLLNVSLVGEVAEIKPGNEVMKNIVDFINKLAMAFTSYWWKYLFTFH